MSGYIINDVRIVTPEGVIDKGYVCINNGIIESIESSGIPPYSSDVVDGNGMWLIPGIIDVHNDAIEKEIEPRPYALFPLEIAFYSLESRLAWHGVTSIYHSLCFMDGESGVRNAERIIANVEGINHLKKSGIIRHNIHARYDITEIKFYEIISNMIDESSIQLLSFMDHTPGQGQYKKIEEYESLLMKSRNMDAQSVRKLVESEQNKSKDIKIHEYIDLLAEKARSHKIPMASHDDDSKEKVRIMKSKGISISEFPIDMETVKAAAEEGQSIVVGAPNIIRGKSNSGNMRAIDAVLSGCADVICSDYLPSSILHAIFIMHREYGIPIHEAVNMATINAAKAVGIDKKLGSIECGKQADLVLVNEIDGRPFVEQLFVNGTRVMGRSRCIL